MIVLVGESGSGKSSIERYLAKNHGYEPIVLYTTRPMRINEKDGIDYHFIEESEFSDLTEKEFFIATSYYNGWEYGVAKKDCADSRIVVIPPRMLRTLKNQQDINVTSFYISVPRRSRLIKALQRGDNIDEAYRRSLSDVGQFDGVENEVDCIVFNWDSNGEYVRSVKEMAEEIIGLLDMLKGEEKRSND